MNRDTIIRSIGQGLVAGGGLLVVGASMGPASWRQGEAHGKPAVAVLVAVLLLGPLLSALTLATTRLKPSRATAAVGGVGSALAAALAAVTAAGEATRDGLAPGGPLAAVGATLAVGGWLVAALTVGLQARFRWTLAAPATVLVVLLGSLGPVGAAALARRATDATTVAAVPAGAPTAPPGLATAWQAAPPGPIVGVAGGVVLVRDRAGVRTLDVRTGRAAWHHLREGWSLVGLGPAAGGSVVVGLWQRDGESVAIAFEAATGTRRWQRKVDASTVDHEVTGPAGLVLLTPRGKPASVLALDVRTGERRWSWRPANGQCAPVSAATTDDPAGDNSVAVAFTCPDGRRVSGLSIVDGAIRWTWAPGSPGEPAGGGLPPRGTAPGGGLPSGYAPLLVPTAGGVLVNDGNTGLVLSMEGGRAGASHTAGGRLAASAGPTALYLGGGNAVGVDLALGRERWKVPLPAATTPVAVTAVEGAGFALVVPDRGGAARLVRFDLSTGAEAADRLVDDASTGVWPAGGTLLVTSTTNAVWALR